MNLEIGIKLFLWWVAIGACGGAHFFNLVRKADAHYDACDKRTRRFVDRYNSTPEIYVICFIILGVATGPLYFFYAGYCYVRILFKGEDKQ